MEKSIAIFLILIFLSGCNAYDTMTEGFKHSQDVAADIENATGSRPFVGFNWSNGSLTSINVTFTGIPAGKTVSELASVARQSIVARFKQEPKQLIISFSIPVSDEQAIQYEARTRILTARVYKSRSTLYKISHRIL